MEYKAWSNVGLLHLNPLSKHLGSPDQNVLVLKDLVLSIVLHGYTSNDSSLGVTVEVLLVYKQRSLIGIVEEVVHLQELQDI